MRRILEQQQRRQSGGNSGMISPALVVSHAFNLSVSQPAQS